jgi:hypothetical protein
MKRIFISITILLLASCSTPEKKKASESSAVSRGPATITMAEFHYRHINSFGSLKKRMVKWLGPVVVMFWPQFEGYKTIDIWIFPENHSVGEKLIRPSFAACVEGIGKDLIYMFLKDENGKIIKYEKNKIKSYTNKMIQGKHKYFFIDDGKKLCFATDQKLLSSSRGWKSSSYFSKNEFLITKVHIPQLFKNRNFSSKSDDLINGLLVNSGDQKENLKKFFDIFKEMEFAKIGLKLDANLKMKIDIPLKWKKGSNFFKNLPEYEENKIPLVTENELASLTLKFDEGKILGLPLILFSKDDINPKTKELTKKLVKLIKKFDMKLYFTKERRLNMKFLLKTTNHDDFISLAEDINKNSSKKQKDPKEVQIIKSKNSIKAIWDIKEPHSKDQKYTVKLFGAKGEFSVAWKNGDFFFNWPKLMDNKLKLKSVPSYSLSLSALNALKLYAYMEPEPRLGEILKDIKNNKKEQLVYSLDSNKSKETITISWIFPLGIWADILDNSPKLLKYLKEQAKKKNPIQKNPPSAL